MDIKDFKIGRDKTWAAWLASVTPIAVKLIREMNERSIPVGRLRAMFKGEEEFGDLPPDLPGVYGFFTANPSDKRPLVKFGETFELFARLLSHIGVKPVKKIVPHQYRVAWQPLLSGRAEFQTWAEWSNDEETTYRASQMGPHPFQARLKPSFDKSLFDKGPAYWKKVLGLEMAFGH